MTMNNILTSGSLNAMSFLTIRIFRKYVSYERSFANQQNAMTNFEPFKYIELLFVPWQVVYKYCDKSFINKPTFFNIVPQLIKKICRAGTACFIDLRARKERRHIFL